MDIGHKKHILGHAVGKQCNRFYHSAVIRPVADAHQQLAMDKKRGSEACVATVIHTFPGN